MRRWSDIQCAEQRLHDASEKNTERYGNNDELWVVCKCFLLVQIADQSRRNDDDARDGTRRDKGGTGDQRGNDAGKNGS